MSEPIPARWFDGRSSRPQAVLVNLHAGSQGPHAAPAPAGTGRRAPGLGQGRRSVGPRSWSAGRAPGKSVVVDLRERGSLEIEDVAGWQARWLRPATSARWRRRMQTRWAVFLGGGRMFAAAGLGAFYRWGTPWAATQITRQVPLDWETGLSARALQDLDPAGSSQANCRAGRQDQLRERFDALARQIEPGMQPLRRATRRALALSFRSGLGANAFALPGGTIVMTDALVEAAAQARPGRRRAGGCAGSRDRPRDAPSHHAHGGGARRC